MEKLFEEDNIILGMYEDIFVFLMVILMLVGFGLIVIMMLLMFDL